MLQVVAPGEYIISARGAGYGGRETCELNVMAGGYSAAYPLGSKTCVGPNKEDGRGRGEEGGVYS